MIIFWILLGALIASAGWYVYLKFHVTGRMTVVSWVLAISAILCLAFTLAWAVASWAEGETQAATMGLLVFGILCLILVALTKKFLSLKTNYEKTMAAK